MRLIDIVFILIGAAILCYAGYLAYKSISKKKEKKVSSGGSGYKGRIKDDETKEDAG